MKKRTAVFGALVSLLPMVQPLLIGTGSFLTSGVMILGATEKVNANSADFFSNSATLKYEEGDYRGSISDLNKAIERNPDDYYLYFKRAFLKDEIRNYYGAISDYTKAIEINSKDYYLYSNRGLSKKNIGDMRGACADWTKASSLGNQKAAKWLKEDC